MRKILLTVLAFGLLGSFALTAQAVNTYGPTTSADRITQIANQARPDSTVSIEQTIIAILRANPDAFEYGNINGLKSGVTLVLPTLEEIQIIPPDEATRTIEQQNNAWKKFTPEQATTKPHVEKQTVTPQHKVVPKAESVTNSNNTSTSSNQTSSNTTLIDRISKLENNVDLINKNITDTDQQYQTRFETVEKQAVDLQNQSQQLSQEVTNLTAQVNQLMEAKKNTWLNKFNTQFNGKGRIVLFIIFGLLIIIALRLIFSSSKPKKIVEDKPMATAAPIATTDYDFMTGQNGAQTKLDLAQAYFDMGNKESARKLLTEVKEIGNPEQKAKADQLLANINK